MWASKTHQVLIASKPIVIKSKPGAKLLVKHPMPPTAKSLRQPGSKPKPKERSKKRPCIENQVEHDDLVEVEILDENPIIRQPWMRIKGTHNLAGQLRMRAEGPHNPLLV